MNFIEKSEWESEFVDIILCEAIVIEYEVNNIREARSKPLPEYLEKKDYAAMIIAAKYKNFKEVGRSRSMDSPTGSHREELHPLLEDALKQAGRDLLKREINIFKYVKVGKKRYFFGSCAEDDVAHKIITKYESSSHKYKKPQFKNLNEICFTRAYRPRTLEREECCIVCRTIFS